MTNEIVPNENQLRNKIHTIRGVQVMLDRDLAVLYGVKAIRLREQVKRNINRFPEDFMFQLTEAEVDLLVSQNAIPSRKHLGGSWPYVFTEQGVAGISGVLTSDRAIEVNIAIMRAFVHMRRFFAANAGLLQRLDTLEQRQISQEISIDKRFNELFDALKQKNILPSQGVFFNGQVFDAYVFVNDLLRQAKTSIVLVDNYVDDSVLMQLSKRQQGVRAIILTRDTSKRLMQDLQKHNSQYQPITIQEFTLSHDRFLILDGETVYHIGASLKDLGRKWFAFSRMDKSALTIMQKIQNIIDE